MIKEAIHKITAGEDLSYNTAKKVMSEIMSGKATQAQIASFLTGLKIKGETIDEITACAAVMREFGVHLNHDDDVLEIVGTGGDESFTFNISTIASIITSAAGMKTAKHGNRSVSSKCGAADVLEAMGVKLNITSEQNEKVLRDTNMCFMFAPIYHSSMKYAAPVRKEMGISTIFNILGPLANPASATTELMGVYKEELVKPLAEVLSNLGVKRGMVVYGQDCVDEVSLVDKTSVAEIDNGKISYYEINPQDYGFEFCDKKSLEGGNAKENAEIAFNILKGEKSAKRNVVVLNAGCALYLGGLADSIKEGVKLAQNTIDSGKALAKAKEFINATNSFS